ncbi:MAG TPA: DUF3137 domain-containing protein [Phycisphaerae bacterium]|nr:DUF3137 domain-containing protein [Phycisphaerae bacterium]
MGLFPALFGPSKEEIWRRLAYEVQGQFVEGGFLKPDKVMVQVDHWIITLDTYVVSTGKSAATFTRMRAPYVNPDNFRFTIYPEGLFTQIGRLFGMDDIKIGDPPFDDHFVIKGNDEAKVRMLFNDPTLKSLLLVQPTIYFEVKDDEGWFRTPFPQGVDELCFHRGGIMKDLTELHALFDLFACTLRRLCRMGSAYEDDPQVSL